MMDKPEPVRLKEHVLALFAKIHKLGDKPFKSGNVIKPTI